MAKRVKKLLKEIQESGQQVYGTKDRPFRTAGNVLVDAALGGRKLKTNLALKAAQAAKKKAADLAAKRKNKDKPPSADTRRMLEESTEDKINRANEEGVQESKTLPKTPKTPKAGKKAKTPKASGPSMGSTAKAGAAAERGALAGRRRKGKVTVEEVQKRAKGGMVKKKTSARKKPKGVGAATRGYGRALR